MCRFQRCVNDNGDPYCSCEENHSAVEVFFPPKNRVESMFAPESPDGIEQEVNGNRRRHDEVCNCCVESCDVLLKEGYGTCDKEGIYGRHLVVERFFDAFWGMEYEDSWQEGANINRTRHPSMRGTHSNRVQ